MAEVLKYDNAAPAFSEILEIISNWSERERLSEFEKEKARGELQVCLNALRDKSDAMSALVRQRVGSLLEHLV